MRDSLNSNIVHIALRPALAITFPLSLHLSRLNLSSSLNFSSQGLFSSPLIILFALLSILSIRYSLAASFLKRCPELHTVLQVSSHQCGEKSVLDTGGRQSGYRFQEIIAVMSQQLFPGQEGCQLGDCPKTGKPPGLPLAEAHGLQMIASS